MKNLKVVFFTFLQLILLHMIAAHAMPTENAVPNVETTKSLFKWNSINLVSHADLKKK